MKIEINKVYNMDCIELMREMEKQGIKVDCVITDPPYLIDYKRHDKNSRFNKAIIGDTDFNLIKQYIKMCYNIMKENTAMFMFCSAKTVDFFKQELEKYFNIKKYDYLG